jgi:hypothetical protein
MGGPDEPKGEGGHGSGYEPRGGNLRRGSAPKDRVKPVPKVPRWGRRIAGVVRKHDRAQACPHRNEASDLREEESLEVEAESRGSRRKSVSGAEPNGKEAGGRRRVGTASRRDQTPGQDARADDRKVIATRAETPRQGMRPRESLDASDDTMEL